MISLDELTDHLGVDPDTEDLELLIVLEKQAVDRAQQVCSRYFGPRAETVEFKDGTGTRWLYLEEEPYTTAGPPAVVVTVERETSPGVWEALAAADFEVRGRRLVNLKSCWYRGRENYRVTYTRGYAAGTEPELVRLAVKREVARLYARRGSEGAKSETYGGYSYTAGDSADDTNELRADLAGWVRPVYA